MKVKNLIISVLTTLSLASFGAPEELVISHSKIPESIQVYHSPDIYRVILTGLRSHENSIGVALGVTSVGSELYDAELQFDERECTVNQGLFDCRNPGQMMATINGKSISLHSVRIQTAKIMTLVPGQSTLLTLEMYNDNGEGGIEKIAFKY